MKRLFTIGCIFLIIVLSGNSLFANEGLFPPDKKGKTHHVQNKKKNKQNTHAQRKGDRDCPCTKNEKKNNQQYHKGKK
jgi:hypothetical protein